MINKSNHFIFYFAALIIKVSPYILIYLIFIAFWAFPTVVAVTEPVKLIDSTELVSKVPSSDTDIGLDLSLYTRFKLFIFYKLLFITGKTKKF